MSSDSESQVVVTGSSAEEDKGALFGNIFEKKTIQRRNARIVTVNLKVSMQILLVYYAI